MVVPQEKTRVCFDNVGFQRAGSEGQAIQMGFRMEDSGSVKTTLNAPPAMCSQKAQGKMEQVGGGHQHPNGAVWLLEACSCK